MKQKIKNCFWGILCLGSMLLAIPQIMAQGAKTTITGTVVDAKGEALLGVSVVVKGSGSGTITDSNGAFRLQTDVTKPTLVVSYIGYETKELIPSSLSNLRITLNEDNKQLEEVVVVGYGTQRKKDLTGSVAVIKSSDIAALPVPSVSDAMQGRAAGVQVISSGEPGTDAAFRIRGSGTIHSNDPLLVIDGLPVSSGLNQLNMADVESLQVLKDASATAIYGSRGANGVVIITTKKGKASGGKSQINFGYSYGLQEATSMVKMLNAEQFATLHNEMMTNAGLTPNPANSDPASLGAGSDWMDALFRTASMQNYTLSYSNSNEKSNIYVSGNYLKQDGIVINTGFERYTFQINTETKLSNSIRFGNNITLNHDVKKKGDYSIKNTMLALPTQAITYDDGTYTGPVAQPMYDGDIVNPIGLAKTVEKATNGYNLMGTVYGEVDLYKGFTFKSTFGLQANLWDSRTWAPKYKWDTSINNDSYLWQQYNKNFTWMWDNQLTYEHAFGKHKLNAMIGTSAQENRGNWISASRKSFVSDITQQMSNGGVKNMTNDGNTYSCSLFSTMGRINYNYNERYLLTTTLRRDGSSRFGSGNKYGWFPSASAAWRISEEEFFKPIRFVSDMKIRAGYGVTGNQEIGNYSFASVLNTINYSFGNSNSSAVVPTRMPNPYVQWESQKQGNIGFDATILNQRVTFSVDAYLKKTEKMLVPMSVMATSGYSDIETLKPSINAGKMENKGIELTINSKNLIGKFVWNTDFNVSYNKNKVVSINDTVPMATNSIGLNYNLALIKAGMPFNEFYGFKTDGIFQTPAEVNNHAIQVPGNDPYNRTSAGDIRFKDLNNDGVINDKDRTYLGSPNPTFIFAMNNYFAYKGFDLSIFLQGVAGNKICNANRFWSEAMDVAQNQTAETINRWHGEGTSNSMPRAVYNDPNKNTRPSDRYIEDGSYLRIKNVTLGYTLPNVLLKQLKLSTARIFITGQNLLTITKYSGFDPEVGTSGIDNNVYPVTRTYSIGINLGF